MKEARVMFGDRECATLKEDNIVMMLFLSDYGRQMEETLKRQEIYVGASTW
jgi:hypothetical protein